jgi:DNA-binding MarR family transcriptional regulator
VSSRSKQDLDVLTAVERGETVSQLVLSRRVGVAVGLVNALLKRAVRKGFVKIRNAPARRYVYYLTPKGFAEKSRLVSEYIEWSLTFFRQAREQYAELFERAHKVGFEKVAIAGQGELAEIAVFAALGQGVTLAGILSPGTNQDRMFGVPVAASPAGLGHIDVVIIADSTRAQATYDELVAVLGSDRVLAPPLLRIAVAAVSEPMPKAQRAQP